MSEQRICILTNHHHRWCWNLAKVQLCTKAHWTHFSVYFRFVLFIDIITYLFYVNIFDIFNCLHLISELFAVVVLLPRISIEGGNIYKIYYIFINSFAMMWSVDINTFTLYTVKVNYLLNLYLLSSIQIKLHFIFGFIFLTLIYFPYFIRSSIFTLSIHLLSVILRNLLRKLTTIHYLLFELE